jgi:hypothetical protein
MMQAMLRSQTNQTEKSQLLTSHADNIAIRSVSAVAMASYGNFTKFAL